ncbi:MAG: TrkH family potassium uptake protein, partial [Spirochaetaceae bacterium]|nr:TrkH family potassium uptake protein [Spirochaetaceae bacterium]
MVEENALKRLMFKPFMFLRVLPLLLGILALIMFPSLVMALAYGETAMIRAFALPSSLALAAAGGALVSLRKRPLRFSPRQGFLLVSLTWMLISLVGALPYYLGEVGLSFTDAIFESTCGFATTGSTTIADVERLPRSLIFWRSMTHWFGGMGIILLSVALLPLLGVGGFQLIKAETPGPEKEKVTPKITATAKILYLVYCGLTAVLAICYLAGGMNWFDALCHAFTVVASGGISTKNAGIASYRSPFIEVVTTIFMLLAAVNFNLYYRLLQGKYQDIVDNSEFRTYLFIFAAAALIITVSILPVYGSLGTALRYGTFQAASVLSTTGNVIADYEAWPMLAQAVIFVLMFIGGCSSSTAGGIKVVRLVVLFKQAGNEMRRLLYPRGIFSIRLNRKVGRKDVVYGVAAFISLYIMVIIAVTLITALSGIEVFSSFSAALAVTGNVGVGFGAIGPTRSFA